MNPLSSLYITSTIATESVVTSNSNSAKNIAVALSFVVKAIDTTFSNESEIFNSLVLIKLYVIILDAST